MQQPIKNRRRHTSSIFELHPQSMVLADILDALKTQPQQHTNPTIEFLSRMLSHLKQLCLTKASTFTVQSLTQTHIRNLLAVPLPQALTIYFRDLVPEVDRLISRLKRVNHKKFTILIRRKISQMFSEIMRHAYDLKMGVLAEKLRQREMERKAAVVLKGFVRVVESRGEVGEAWGKLQGVLRDDRRNQRKLYDKWKNTIEKLDRLAKKRNTKLKLGCMNLWNINTKELAYESTSQIYNLIKTIYLSAIDAIEDQCQIHQLINLSLRRISETEAAQFRYHRPMDNLMIGFGNLSDSPNLTEATQKEIECLSKRTVVYEDSIQLIPVGEIGVFRVPLQGEMSAKILESILVLANGLGDIVQKIYSIRSRLEYYDKDCRSLNQLSQIFGQRYLQLQSPQSLPSFLDQLFLDAEFSHFQIMFLQENDHQTFYKYSRPQCPIQQLTSQAILMLRDEFLKPNCKPYLQVSRSSSSSATSFTVFPIWQDNLIKGLIKFGYPYELPTDGLVESLKVFVDTLVMRSRQRGEVNQISFQRSEREEEFGRTDTMATGLEITKAKTYEDIGEAVANIVRKIIPKSYCCLLWPVKQPAQYFWTPLNDEILTTDSVLSLSKSPSPYQILSMRQHEDISQLVKKFPLFEDYRLFQYQHPQQNLTMASIPIRSRHNEVLGMMLVGEIQVGLTDLEVKIEELLEVQNYVRARMKQGMGAGLTWKEEHHRRQLKDFFNTVSNFHIEYQCFEECLDRLFTNLYGNTQTRIFTITNKNLQQHNNPSPIQFLESLPTSPYCSHNHLLFCSTSLRFRNKLSIKSNRTSLLFRSQVLRQKFFSFMEQISENADSALGQSSRQITTFEKVLGLSEVQYVYIPISKNGFVVLVNDRKWTEWEVLHLEKFLKKQFVKVEQFRNNILKERKEIAIAEIRAVLKSQRRWQIGQILRRFKKCKEFKQRRVQILKNIVMQNMDKKGLLYSFFRFKELSAHSQQYLLQIQNQLHNFENTLSNIYRNNTFKAMKQYSIQSSVKLTKRSRSISTIENFLKGLAESQLRQSFVRIHLFSSHNHLNCKQQRNHALLALSQLISKKERRLYRFALESIDERWKEFIEIFAIIAEELRLVSFNKEISLIEFVQQRLTDPIRRLSKPFEKTVFSVQIVPRAEFKYGNNYLILRETPQVVVVGWELSNSCILAMTVSSKLRLEGNLLVRILDLKQSLVKCHTNIITNLQSKILSLSSAFNNLYLDNLQSAFKTLSRNVLKSIQSDNKRSKITLKQIQSQLSDLSNQTQTNKQNESITKELNQCKKQIGALQDQFTNIKIQNQLKRKTLAVSLMMNRFEQQKQVREKTTKFMINLQGHAWNSQIQSQRNNERLYIEDLKIRRYSTGTNMFCRFVKATKNKVCKEAFESMLGRAYRQLSLLR